MVALMLNTKYALYHMLGIVLIILH